MTNSKSSSEHIRSIVWDLVWAALTCGLFNIYVQKKQMLALNSMLKQEKYDFWSWLGFSIITCGLGTAFRYLFSGQWHLSWATHPFAILSPIILVGIFYFGRNRERQLCQKAYQLRWWILAGYTLWGINR